MSRGTKSKAVSGENGSPPYEESGSVNMKMVNRFRIVKERFDKQHIRSKDQMDRRLEKQDKKLEAFY